VLIGGGSVDGKRFFARQLMRPVYGAGMSASSERPAEASIAAGEDLAFAGVLRLSELLRAGELTPRELVELYLTRIELLDPKLGAFVSVRAEAALAEADAALERLRANESGSLLGVPVAVKDNVDIAGEVTGHGTGANETPATSDAEVVRRLRVAGAPMLGKTAMPELAMWGHMTESQTHGPTRNPWDTARCAGGSSGGNRRGRRRWPGAGRARVRWWRVDPSSVGAVWAVRAQADPRAHLYAARSRALAWPDCVWWPGSQCARRCAV
jgi:hypothetical protein